jgi:ribosomal protein S18 acetylase RimI-like enzyme
MATRATVAPATLPDPAKLRRASAGRYTSGDGRFVIEAASGGWMVEDAEQADDLGLPLMRGPYATLGEVRAALDLVRSGPAPVSDLPDRIAALPKRAQRPLSSLPRGSPPPAPAPPPLAVREYRTSDGTGLRALWDAADFRSHGDDDASLRAFAQRNPGTFLVAVQGARIVGSAMGAWDGRRGWIYRVATDPSHRRGGLATRLVREIEERLRALGCRKVNVIVRDGNERGAAFWEALGYSAAPARQMARELDEPAHARARDRTPS